MEHKMNSTKYYPTCKYQIELFILKSDQISLNIDIILHQGGPTEKKILHEPHNVHSLTCV